MLDTSFIHQAIHRALQQTINPQELAITLKSDLDRWAQRSVNITEGEIAASLNVFDLG